jgi:hypothetical protein
MLTVITLGVVHRFGGYNVTVTVELDDELAQRLERHLEEDESYEEFIAELVSMYETEGEFLTEGYSE